MSLFHKNSGHAHPRADTHGCDADFLSCPSQLIVERRYLSGPSTTKGVPESLEAS